jgi:hypothetical protein
MGFTDLLSSSRGPGVIGTLIALLVLVGFGTLYLFVFDEGLQGGQKTIEAVIRDQGLEIENHKIQIKNARERLEQAAVFKAKGKEADDLKVRAGIAAKRIAELTDSKAAGQAAVESAVAAWETYKDEYRASEWAAAVGTEMDDIKTSDGVVFTNVKITKVDHKGIAINHSGGSKTLKPEELPAELFDRFQFDLAKKEEIVKKIDSDFDDHSDNVQIATLAKSGRDKLIRAGELREEIVELRSQIEKARLDQGRQQSAIDRHRMAIAAEKAKKGGISRAPQMEEQLKVMVRSANASRDSIPVNERKVRNAQGEISTLEREVTQIKADIAKLKKELEEKKASAPQP